MSLPVSQLGWMAGILDLKGKILRKNNKLRRTQQIVLCVDSSQITVIRELSRMTGTNPELKNNSNPRPSGWYRRGCLEHCEDAHIHVDSDWTQATARWTVTGASMAVVLSNVLPYIRNDAGFTEAHDEALSNAALDGRGATATMAAIRRLHELGWDVPAALEPQLEVTSA